MASWHCRIFQIISFWGANQWFCPSLFSWGSRWVKDVFVLESLYSIYKSKLLSGDLISKLKMINDKHFQVHDKNQLKHIFKNIRVHILKTHHSIHDPTRYPCHCIFKRCMAKSDVHLKDLEVPLGVFRHFQDGYQLAWTKHCLVDWLNFCLSFFLFRDF